MPLCSLEQASSQTERWFAPAVIGIALLYVALLGNSAVKESPTADESAHIVAGYSYWVKHDYRLNPEHPPLSKLLCTIPLLFLRPRFPDNAEAWEEADQFQLGKQLLYSTSNDAGAVLRACRLVTILFTAGFGVLLAFWTRRNVSAKAALLAFLLFVLDPNIAAHARYVTSDIFVSAFFFSTCVFWYGWLYRPSNRTLLLTGASLGLALASKFSAVLLVPILFFMWAFAKWRGPRQGAPGTSLSRLVAALVLVPYCILLVCYAGDTRSVAEDPLIRNRFQQQSRTPSAWQEIRVPAYYWFRGLQLLFRHEVTGHPAYLLGEMSDSGFRSYFPVAIAVKTSTGTLLLGIGAAVAALFFRRRIFTLRFAILIPPVFYLIVAIFARIDIGIRHILLVYPFIYVVLASVVERASNRRWVPVVVASALLLNLVEFVRIYPHPTAFFNTLAGGPTAGPRYLLDSNIDWGQGLIHLKEELASRPGACLALSYFGRAEPGYYIPNLREVPGTLAEAKGQPCLIAVSVQNLYGDPDHRLDYLWKFQPVARPSYAIYLYDASRF